MYIAIYTEKNNTYNTPLRHATILNGSSITKIESTTEYRELNCSFKLDYLSSIYMIQILGIACVCVVFDCLV